MDVKFIQLNKNIELPIFNVEKGMEIVNYGVNNDIPDMLLKYHNEVGLHRAIINKKKNMFLGNGLSFDIVDNDNQSKKTLNFLDNVNEFESIDELFNKIAVDMFLFGGTYLQVIWEGNKIKSIYHMPFQKMRSGIANKFGFVEKYFYNPSDDKLDKWQKYSRPQDKGIIEFNAFNTSKNKTKPQILYIKNYDPSNIYYSLPDYIGALKDLDTMAAISDFHNANIHNNMQPGLSIFFKGPAPDKEKQDAIVKAIKTKYQDTENAGKPMVFFLDNEDDMRIEPIETGNVGEMYANLASDVKENITVSHQIPRAVSGLINPGSLGNSKELLEGIEIVYSQYIQPIQEFVLSRFNKLMGINGLKPIYFVNPSANMMKYGISELRDILTVNELRDYLGYEPLAQEDREEDIREENNNVNNTENNE